MARHPALASLPLSATLLAIAIAAPGADAPLVAPAANGAVAGSNGLTAQSATPPTAAPSPADGGELALFEEMPVVVSASRRESRLSESSAPVSVVTADDIKYSGQRTIPEVLQFTPGVDVLTVDRNRPAVGVRGLHDHFSDRTLTLIDGRPAESPIYGGGEYSLQPVFIDDIERIEVVRGPGGAVWGANAYNGVINIITKDPERTPGVRATAQLDSLGDSYTSLRWGEVHGAWAWRVSIGYDDRTASQTITHRPASSSPPEPYGPYGYGDDWSRTQRYDATGSYQIDNATRLRFGAGFQRSDHGAEEFVLYQPDETAQDDVVRSFAKAEREFGGGAQASLQWSGEYERLHEPSIAYFDNYVNQLDGQVDLREIGGHALTFGASGKVVDVAARSDRVEQATFGDEVYREYWYGGFAVDRWHVVDPLTIEAQGRGDSYSGTEGDWAGRLAALYALDRDQNHVLRVAVARAYRTPLLGLRDASFERDQSQFVGPPFGTVTFPIYQVVPTDDVKNEHTWSLEGGLSSRPTPELLLRLDAFVQRYTDLIGFDPTLQPTNVPGPLVPPFPATYQQYHATNHAGAWARGFETEATWTAAAPWSAQQRIRVDAWYAFDRFVLDHDDRNESIRAYQPPEHSVGGGVRWFAVGDVVLNLNYRHTGITRDDPGRSVTNYVHASDRLDASLSWPFTHHASLMVGCDDILDRTGYAVEGLANAASFQTPGRSFYMRGDITF